MDTTTLLVEIVIIGFQVLVWISLIVLTFFGHNWIDFSTLKDWSTEIALGLIAASYTFGIIFDNLTASFFSPWSYRTLEDVRHQSHFLRGRNDEAFSTSPFLMRSHIMATNSDLSDNLEKNFNQSRLLRATSINLLLIGITSFIWILKQAGFSWTLFIVLLLSVFVLVVLAIWTWARTLRAYYSQLFETYNVLMQLEKKQDTDDSRNLSKRKNQSHKKG